MNLNNRQKYIKCYYIYNRQNLYFEYKNKSAFCPNFDRAEEGDVGMKKIIKEFMNIEEEFFELDHEKKIAHLQLEFKKPSDIFDVNAKTKKPVLNDEFADWVKSSFEYAPRKYKINLEIVFDDLEGYDEEELEKIFFSNIMLEAKKANNQTIAKNKIALGLIGLGVVFFVIMMLVTNLWQNGGIAKDIIAYVMDIGTTVTFWEAMTILIVENKEKRDLYRDLIKRYDAITFRKRQ